MASFDSLQYNTGERQGQKGGEGGEGIGGGGLGGGEWGTFGIALKM